MVVFEVYISKIHGSLLIAFFAAPVACFRKLSKSIYSYFDKDYIEACIAILLLKLCTFQIQIFKILTPAKHSLLASL